jgi:hypothetical protein
MRNEFKTTGINTAISTNGFTVQAMFARISYDDAAGKIEIYAEWLGSPTGVVLYKRSLDGMSTSRIDIVLSNVTRALKYMGHQVEICADE